jgi:hypothetical protein
MKLLLDDIWSISESEEDNRDNPPILVDWTPPDLSVGGEQYKECVASLWEAADTLSNPEEIVRDGLKLLTTTHQGGN